MVASAMCLVLLAAASLACGYYVLLTTLGWLPPRRVPARPDGEALNVAVVMPAHDEEAGVAAAVESVLASDYPAGRLEVVVVADNCSDATAAEARRAGAQCVERVDPDLRGKGYALAFGIPFALKTGADAVAVVDADCRLAPGCLAGLVAALETGAAVAQAEYVVTGDGPTGLVAGVGAAVENAVEAGRGRLGASASLRGTGMLFRRGVLERAPWSAFGLTEDAEYGATLARLGVRVRFVPGAKVFAAAPPGRAALATQRKRWRAAVWQKGQGLLSRWLASKPLVLAQLAATVACVAACSPWLPQGVAVAFGTWAAALTLVTATVYLRAIRRTGTPVGGVAGLGRAGVSVASLAWVTLAGVAARRAAWDRTPRGAGTP